MNKALSLLVAALFLVAFSPMSLAQDEGEEATPTEETATEEGEKKEGDADDPWSVPDAAEKADEDKKAEEAAAAEPEIVAPTGYPTAEIDRPLALTKMTLEPMFGITLNSINPPVVDRQNMFYMNFGAGMGVIDDVEAGLLFPLMLSPEFEVGDMMLYGLYELGPFVDDKLRTAARLSMHLPFQGRFRVLLDAPVKFKFHDMFAAVGGVGLGMWFIKDNTAFLINFDFGALVQPMEQLALSLLFGIHMGLAEHNVNAFPLIFRGQYTLMGDLDIIVDFSLMNLDQGADYIQFNLWAAYRLGL